MGWFHGATIKNITVSGDISTTNDYAAGIAGYDVSGSFFENCKNEAHVFSNGHAGGIVGEGGSKIFYCCNEGCIEGTANAAGIAGRSMAEISNCYNNGSIIATAENSYAGGIVGFTYGCNFLNCYNGENGNITSGKYAGGIVGWLHYSGYSIDNSYNLGKIDAITAGGIVGYIYNDVKCRNCYSTGNITGTTVGGIVGNRLWDNTSVNVFKNCYYIKSTTVTQPVGKTMKMDDNGVTALTQSIINDYNTYILNDPDTLGKTNWLKWQIDAKAVPSFIN